MSPETAPVQRLASVAALAPAGALERFQPTDTHRAIAGALISQTTAPPTFQALADVAGVSVGVLHGVMDNPDACSWIINYAAERSRFGLAQAYIRLFEKAMTSDNSAWMTLFLRRFDLNFESKSDGQSIGSQHIHFHSMTNEELENFVRFKTQKKFGEPEKKK
jgi:hypothetical protein